MNNKIAEPFMNERNLYDSSVISFRQTDNLVDFNTPYAHRNKLAIN